MGYYDGAWGFGDWLAMIATMVIFWGLVVGVVVWAAHSIRSDSGRAETGSGRTTGAEQVLAERFARGEIDEDEFQRRRELLHTTAKQRT